MSNNTNAEKTSEKNGMITVWEWTGTILMIYSVILIISGILYEPKIFSVNTSLVWGIFLFVFSFILIYSGRKTRLKKIIFILSLLFPAKSYLQKRELTWEFLHPNPSLEGTGGLFRTVSARTFGFKNFTIGTYFGFFNTPNDTVLVISRDYFALKERKEKVMFDKFDSVGFFNYIFLGTGAPAIRTAGFLTGDLSLAIRNISILVTQRTRGQEIIEDNIQSFGDFIITPKVSYTLEARFLTLAAWSKIYLLSKYRSPSIAAVSVAPGISSIFDFDEMESIRNKLKNIDLFNPKIYLSVSMNFDNSEKVVPAELSDLFPSFVKTAMLIEPYNHLQTGFGIEAGDAERGIGKYISGFIEWYLFYYIPPPDLITLSTSPHFLSVGVRFKPIPLISKFISPVPQEIKEASIFLTADINTSSSISVPFEIGPTVYLKNSYPWAIFFGMNIYWNPWESGQRFILGEGGKAKIKVVDSETLLPIGDVIVSYPGLDMSNQSTDPSSGEIITYELPPGEWDINFRKTGYESQSVKVQIEKGVIKEIEVTMSKQKALSYLFGSVRSASDGLPIPARIEVEGSNLPPIFAKPQDGSYEITLQSGNYKLKFSSDGFNPAEIDVKLLGGDKKRYDIILEPVQEIIQRIGETALKEPKRKITIEKETKSILLPEKILFDDNTNDVLPTSAELIRELAEFIKKELPDKKIIVEVHTSPIKSKEEDIIITQKRAEKIITLLEKYGISRDKITPVGKGSDFPIFPNDTPEGKAGNRRVYFYIQD